MFQQWLNFTGLSLDFLGVVLLAYEWRIALIAEQREAGIAAAEQRLRPSPTMPRPNNPHQAVFDHMNEQRRFHQQSARMTATTGMRRNWFAAAFLLIALGFMLQIAGSFPMGLVP